jgi:choline dehydrogenase
MEDSNHPDIQYMFTGFTKQTSGFKQLCSIYGYFDEYLDQLYQANQEAYLLKVQTTLLHPKSRGKIELKSTDPNELPIIQTNYLDNQEDVDTLIRGIQKFKPFMDTNVFKRNQIEEVMMKVEECDKLKYDSHEYWECYVRYFAKTIYQFVGNLQYTFR